MSTLQIRELGSVRSYVWYLAHGSPESESAYLGSPKTFAPMDIWEALSNSKIGHDIVIKTVDMHTSGEATRIVLPLTDQHGQFILQGRTLLEKRSYAKDHADWLRQRIMHEPRGHSEMYGAILVPETELTLAGEADIGVLFCHNEGYSTMCGHASIALGRFLVDTTDTHVFPHRSTLSHIAQSGETIVRLHAPCGIVRIRVPTTNSGSCKSDPSRQVSFESVPSFVGAIGVKIDIPEGRRWPALQAASKESVTVDISYGGAFYAIASTDEFGFVRGYERYSIFELDEATRTVKDLLRGRRELYAHPTEVDMEYLYGIILTEQLGKEHELGACFFANQQLDRSPTGSGVCARVALACKEGNLGIGEEVQFESPVSKGKGMAFTGKAMKQVTLEQKDGRLVDATLVTVSGQAYYTGAHTFVAEQDDELANGFIAPC